MGLGHQFDGGAYAYHIKSFAYAMTNFVLKDAFDKGKRLSASAAITQSRRLMDGHKWDFFVLNLSFIGWYLLASLTFGLGFLWLVPHMATTTAAFYQDLVDHSQTPADATSDKLRRAQEQYMVKRLGLLFQPFSHSLAEMVIYGIIVKN